MNVELSLTQTDVKFPLVVESKNGLIANLNPLEVLISEVEKEKDKALAEVGVKSIDDLSSKISSFVGKFQRYRIDELSVITDIPKEFIKLENNLKEIVKELSSVSDERTQEEREATYKVADENMRVVLDGLVSSSRYGEKVDLRVFDAEFSKMRTKAYAQPTSTGKPKGKLVEKITNLWNIEYSPIEEKEVIEDAKRHEAVQFEQVLRPTDVGYEEIVKTLHYYNDLLTKIPTLYPNSIDDFNRTINAKLEVINASLEAKKEKAKEEAEAKARAIIDERVGMELKTIKSSTLSSKDECNVALVASRTLYRKTNNKELMQEIHDFANSIKQILMDIELKEKEEKRLRREEEERYRREKREEEERLRAEEIAMKEEEDRLEAEAIAEEERLRAEAIAEEERLKAEAVAEEERLKAEAVAEVSKFEITCSLTELQLNRIIDLLNEEEISHKIKKLQ